MGDQAKVSALLDIKKDLIKYLIRKVEVEDWHGVADAAMDLREIEAKIEVLNNVRQSESV